MREIIGNTTTTPVPRSDWKQTDAAKADFIKNKPTKVSQFENDADYATNSDVDQKIAQMVDSAPETLDTLNELAEALGDDPNFATTVINKINTKVDKVAGKQLSTEDYTTEDKNKVTNIKLGTGKKSLTIMSNNAGATPIASGDYSFAVGTDDKSVISELGTAITSQITATMPEAQGDISIAGGMSSKAQSAGSIAVGFQAIAGIKGYYWYDITVNADGTALISLSKKQSLTSIESVAIGDIDWQVGDYISIVNKQKYSFCAKITAISTVSKRPIVTTYNTVGITVDASPFGTNAYGTLENLALAPDDKSIFAVSRVQDSTTEAYKIVPRTGSVELGWGAQAWGLGNLAAGTFSTAFGMNNVQAGDFGLIAGRENVGAYGNIVGGGWNTSTGLHSVLVGKYLTNTGNYSILTGLQNKNSGLNVAMFGHTNTNSGEHVFIHGYENHNDGTGDKRCDYVDMHGTRLNATRRLQMLRGQWNIDDERALAIWANGTSDTNRKNVFTIAANGTPEVATDGVNLGYLDTAAFKQKIVAALPIYNGEVESV